MYPGFLRSMSNAKGSKEPPKASIPQKAANQEMRPMIVQNNEILSLAEMVFQFREALRKFSSICSQYSHIDPQKPLVSLKDIHENLGVILIIIKKVVDKFPSTASAEVYSAVNSLVNYVQSFSRSDFSVNEMNRLISRLAVVFSIRVKQRVTNKPDSILSSSAILKKEDAKPTSKHPVFGIDLDSTELDNSSVPFLVIKCIKNIEEHGMHIKGIYRLSAVKSKVDQLCEEFEKYGNDIKLDSINPNIIANVLKLYLRQLPQPLFTFDLYPDFIRLGKLYVADLDTESKARCLDDVSTVLKKLPKSHYATAAIILNHLNSVSKEAEVNNMSAYNLAVIFGPTLLHCMKNGEDTNPKVALCDNTHQIRAIELMISAADKLF